MSNKMTEYIFNRRVVSDQTIYVMANSLAEAWRKARDEDAHDTSDEAVRRVTIRRLTDDR